MKQRRRGECSKGRLSAYLSHNGELWLVNGYQKRPRETRVRVSVWKLIFFALSWGGSARGPRDGRDGRARGRWETRSRVPFSFVRRKRSDFRLDFCSRGTARWDGTCDSLPHRFQKQHPARWCLFVSCFDPGQGRARKARNTSREARWWDVFARFLFSTSNLKKKNSLSTCSSLLSFTFTRANSFSSSWMPLAS